MPHQLSHPGAPPFLYDSHRDGCEVVVFVFFLPGVFASWLILLLGKKTEQSCLFLSLLHPLGYCLSDVSGT